MKVNTQITGCTCWMVFSHYLLEISTRVLLALWYYFFIKRWYIWNLRHTTGKQLLYYMRAKVHTSQEHFSNLWGWVIYHTYRKPVKTSGIKSTKIFKSSSQSPWCWNPLIQFLMLWWPSRHKIILFLLNNCNFTTAMNCYANI